MPAAFIVVFNHIPKLIATVEATSRSAPKKVADTIAAEARSRAPKDTGYLAGSISSRSLESGKTAEVFVEADYAAYVEFGTWKMAAQPFLSPAFAAHEKELSLALSKASGGGVGVF